MRAPFLLVVLFAVLLATACGTGGDSSAATVSRVLDGDTVELEGGKRVRLLQIDTPELREGECYAGRSRLALEALAPPGTEVRLEADPALDETDRYGRLLRYVFVGDENVNLELVAHGAAGVYFFEGRRGRYADELVTAGEAARSGGRGLWGACPATLFDTGHQVDARP
jgi:micrococcal nuclease